MILVLVSMLAYSHDHGKRWEERDRLEQDRPSGRILGQRCGNSKSWLSGYNSPG